MTTHSPIRVAVIGAALSANKGAAAMVETVISRLPDAVGDCEFTILTTYPREDAHYLDNGSDARIVGLQPMRLALIEFPMACLVAVARVLHLPLFWVRSRGCRSMLDADVVVDVAGISFADHRGIPILFYNAIMTGTPLLLGTPVVKAAQALGPFDSTVNRFLAKLVLPRLAAICARGAHTRQHLDSLGLTNVVDVADLAFSLDDSAVLPDAVTAAIKEAGQGFIVVMPSSVVRRIVEAQGIDYVEAIVHLVNEIRQTTQRGVVIAAHSYRVGHPEGRMNDGPVCREVAARCVGDAMVVGVDADLSAGELRRLVAQSAVTVTSRFHAMISGLSTCTPTLVVGWSHKYREVLDDFGLAEYGMDATALADPPSIAVKVGEMLHQRDAISQQIRTGLAMVKERSLRNFEVIAQVVKK